MLDRVSGKGAPVATVFVVGPPALRQQGAQPLRRVRGGLAARHRGRGRGRPAGQGPRHGHRLHRQALLLAGPARRARRRSTSATRTTRRCSPTATACATGRPANVGTLPEESDAALRRLGRRRDRHRGPGPVRPRRSGAVQVLHRLAVQLGRHGARQRPERRDHAPGLDHGAHLGRQRAAGRPQDHVAVDRRSSTCSRRRPTCVRTSTPTARSSSTRSCRRRPRARS